MMWLLTLLGGEAWGRTLATAGACLVLGFGGGVIVGFDMAGSIALSEKVAALAQLNERLVLISKSKDAQIETAQARAEEDQIKQEAFDAEIKKYMLAPSSKSDSCKLDAAQLRWLSSATTR